MVYTDLLHDFHYLISFNFPVNVAYQFVRGYIITLYKNAIDLPAVLLPSQMALRFGSTETETLSRRNIIIKMKLIAFR